MAEIQAPPPLPKSQPSFGRRHSTIIKLLGVGALVLVLLIPLMMITGVLSDRLRRAQRRGRRYHFVLGQGTKSNRAGAGDSLSIQI